MAGENYEPDWNSWLLVRAWTIEEAVALSLNVDPRRLLAWKMSKTRTQPTEIAKFEDRVYWVKKWGLRDPNGIAAAVQGWPPTICPREFVQHAKDVNWELPAPLLPLIAADVDAHGSDEQNGTDASQITARPSGISETAKGRLQYGSYLNDWLALQDLRVLQKVGADATAREFWFHCHDEKPEISLPARWRSIVGSVEKHIRARLQRSRTSIKGH